MDESKWDTLQKKMGDWITSLILEKLRNPELKLDMPSRDDPKYETFKMEFFEVLNFKFPYQCSV